MALAAAAFVLGAPSAAEASVASVNAVSGVARYDALPGEANAVVVSAEPGSIVFTDPAVTIMAGSGCTVVDPPTAHVVRCNATTVSNLQVNVNDLSDAVVVDESVYAERPGVIVLVGAGTGDDDVVTGSGRDIVFASAGDDDVDSGAGADDVDGADGTDELAAGAGNDVLSGGAGADSLEGGADDDRFDETEAGSAGADRLDGGPGQDRLSGGPETDRDADALSGGDGNDVLDYSPRTTPLLVTLDGQANDGSVAGENDDVADDIELVRAGGDSDTLRGGARADGFDGGPGDDLIDGGGGDDTIEGGADSGSDGLSGGAGNDTVRGGAGDDSLAGGAGVDTLQAGGGSDALSGEAGDDVLAGGPGLDALDGGDGDDTLRGADEILIGADGADEIAGGAGNDTVLGGPGNDVLDGGLGADSLRGEDGRDTVTYQDRATPVTVTLDDLPNDGEDGEGDNVASDVEEVVGGTVGDTLRGNAFANVLTSGSGQDFIEGGNGTDSLSGGNARDTLRSRDSGRDVVSCGAGVDFAIVDRRDVVRDCEHVDDATRSRPRARRDALVTPSRGQLALRLPGTSRFILMQERLMVPLGATVDARDGTARLVTAATRRAPVQQGSFTGGQFRVRQTRERRPVTVLRLTGGDLGRCVRASGRRRGAAYAAQAPGRRLWGRVGRKRGRYRTRGNHSSGTVRGTVWLTEDRCDGTLTRVVRGTVAVRDFTLRRTVLVRAGESYLARAR